MKNKDIEEEEEEDQEEEDQEDEEEDEEVHEIEDEEEDEEDEEDEGEGDEDDEDQDEDDEGLDDEDDEDDEEGGGGEPKAKKAKIDLSGALENFESEMSRIKDDETALSNVNTLVNDICSTINDNHDFMKSVEALSTVSKAFIDLCKHVKAEDKHWKLFDGTANKHLEAVAQIIIETFEDVLDNCTDELYEEDAYRSAQLTLEELVKEPYMAVIITGMSEYNELWDSVESKVDEFNELADNEENGDDDKEGNDDEEEDEEEDEEDEEEEDGNEDDDE